jgi:hypothetical protein
VATATTNTISTVVEREEKADPEKEEEEDQDNARAPVHPISGQRKEEEEEERGEGEGGATTSSTTIHHQGKGRAYLEKVNERKRTWDYFEINHPKAISDKKLEQLKAKYTRRKTEACLATSSATTAVEVGKKQGDSSSSNESSKDNNAAGRTKAAAAAAAAPHGRRQPGVPSRTYSMPLIQQPAQQQLSEEQLGRKQQLPQLRPLNLAWDPLTGASIGEEEEEQEQDKSETTDSKQLIETEEHVVNRKSSSGYRLSGGHFADLLREEQIIPREEVLECFIDPFTGDKE